MNRRESIKTIALGAISSSLLLSSCAQQGKNEDKKLAEAWSGSFEDWESSSGRQEFERNRDKKLMSSVFFNKHEMETISALTDIIIPKDEKSGSATDAGVPEFIEFMAKDIPRYQIPLRGGIRWLDHQMSKYYGQNFIDCTEEDQLDFIDKIAWPEEAAPQLEYGAHFFSLVRNLTATGFFTSKIGIEDLGYAGNSPTVWDGVPQEVLKQQGLSYSQKQLDECVKKEDHGELFVFS